MSKTFMYDSQGKDITCMKEYDALENPCEVCNKTDCEDAVLTKVKLQKKHGVYRLETPSEAKRQLSKEEAEQYERSLIISKRAFEEYWDDDDSGDID